MFRFFLFMACVMAVGTSTAEGVSSCTVDTVPIQFTTPGRGGTMRSVAEISDGLPYFRAFVTDVTKHINARLAKDKFCINGVDSMKSMDSARRENRSLLQFVRWPLIIGHEYIVPAMPSTGWHGGTLCRISSPWIDLAVEQKPVPQIVGIVRWNERQLLADQAALAGAKNVLLGTVMPLSPSELGYFTSEVRRESAAKPVEARVPPDILWLLHSWVGTEERSTAVPFIGIVSGSMHRVTEKGAEGYTKLVITLIDRCFASDGKTELYYSNILDVIDPVLLKQYKIDTPNR
jgi:hypothetical protein